MPAPVLPVTLSAEERRLLSLIVAGRSPDQSAQALDLPLHRTEQTLERLQRRLGAPTRHALIVRAILQRWV